MFAPIVLFVYNRLWHTRQTVESLQKNKFAINSDLFIFSDGPKNISDSLLVDELRSYLKTISGFKSVNVIEKKINNGLSKSIITGVGEIVERFGKVIVLEDDIVTSPFFLKYMNDALGLYENENKVASVHGYVYPVKEELPNTFFLRGADCWGWATWKRAWKMFEPDGKKLLNELEYNKLTDRFDFYGGYPFTQMLKNQVMGRNNSWAIRWHASVFLKEKLTLYPRKSLVKNIGFDNSGVHSGFFNIFSVETCDSFLDVKSIPIVENVKAYSIIERYFKSPRLRLYITLIKFKQYLKNLLYYVRFIR